MILEKYRCFPRKIIELHRRFLKYSKIVEYFREGNLKIYTNLHIIIYILVPKLVVY